MDSQEKSRASIGKRILQEVKNLALLTVYFYVTFVTVVFFKATVLHSYGVRYVVWGTALFKAVLIAKFMLIGQAMKIGDGYRDAPLIKPILHKVFGFLILLLVLTSVEEVATGLLHHRSISATFHEIAGPRKGETVAEVLILLLVLIPFVAFDVFRKAIGKDSLEQLLFKGRTPELAASSEASMSDGC